MEQKPSVGRVVHYTSYGTPKGEFAMECRAAIITAVKEDGTVDICIMNPTGLFFAQNVKMNPLAEPHGGTWHWPERV